MPQDGEKGKARLAAQQFLIKERVTGPAELSRIDFASLVNRFSSIADLPFQDVRAPFILSASCVCLHAVPISCMACLLFDSEGVSHIPHHFVSFTLHSSNFAGVLVGINCDCYLHPHAWLLKPWNTIQQHV